MPMPSLGGELFIINIRKSGYKNNDSFYEF